MSFGSTIELGKKMSIKSKEKNRIAHLKENLSDKTRLKMSESAKKKMNKIKCYGVNVSE